MTWKQNQIYKILYSAIIKFLLQRNFLYLLFLIIDIKPTYKSCSLNNNARESFLTNPWGTIYS